MWNVGMGIEFHTFWIMSCFCAFYAYILIIFGRKCLFLVSAVFYGCIYPNPICNALVIAAWKPGCLSWAVQSTPNHNGEEMKKCGEEHGTGCTKDYCKPW